MKPCTLYPAMNREVFESAGAPESSAPVLFAGSHRGTKAEELGGIFLEDQRPDIVLERGLREIRHPAVRGEQRIVRSKEHFRSQQRVRVLHQVRRKIFRRPARKIDVNLGLV